MAAGNRRSKTTGAGKAKRKPRGVRLPKQKKYSKREKKRQYCHRCSAKSKTELKLW